MVDEQPFHARARNLHSPPAGVQHKRSREYPPRPTRPTLRCSLDRATKLACPRSPISFFLSASSFCIFFHCPGVSPSGTYFIPSAVRRCLWLPLLLLLPMVACWWHCTASADAPPSGETKYASAEGGAEASEAAATTNATKDDVE